MLRQSPNRKVRTRGFKVKQADQICLLLTIFIWFLFQVRHLHYKNKENEEPSPMLLSKSTEAQEKITKFGRKDLINPLADTSLLKGRQEKDEESREDIKDAKHEDEEQDVVEGGGVRDDDIDVNDQERDKEEDSGSELEDLINEEDRVKEDASLEEEIEGQTGRGKGSQGLRKVEEEDENDAEESTQKLVDTAQGFGSVNGKDISNWQDPPFFRDGLIDKNGNPDGDA